MMGLPSLYMGASWPCVATADTAYEEKVIPMVVSWWRQRLGTVRDPWLSEAGRAAIEERVESVRRSHRDGAGFEWIAGMREGEQESLWALGLGHLTWAHALLRLRMEKLLPGHPDDSFLDRLEVKWRVDPEHALNLLTTYVKANPESLPWASWYWVPLRLWRDAPLDADDIIAIDTFVATLSAEAIGVLGIGAPLTIAFALARQGSIKQAAVVLDPLARRVGGMLSGPLASPEVTFQRSRYRWLAGQAEAAGRDLIDACRARPSYLLRAVTDPVWHRPLHDDQSIVATQIGAVVRDLREMGNPWREPTVEMQKFPGAKDLAHAAHKASESFYDAFLLAPMLQRAETWRHGIALLTPQLNADLEALRQFSEAIPADLPLRLAVTDALVFKSPSESTPSDLGILRRTLREGTTTGAAALARQLVTTIPTMCRLALSGYGLRLLDALDAAVVVVKETSDETTDFRLGVLEKLIEGCRDLAAKLNHLENETGDALGRGVSEIWRQFQQIERGWVETDRRAFGTLDLRLLEPLKPMERGSNAVIRLGIFDAHGQPVGGVPVEWSVLHGPAKPVDRMDGVAIEWSTSLSVGTVLLRIRAGGVGQSGVVRARILGTPRIIDIPFTVLERPEAL